MLRTILLGLLVLVGLFNLSLGFIALFGNKQRTSSYAFFVLCASVFIWATGVAVFLGTTNANVASVAARVYYCGAAVIGYALLVFSLNYVASKESLWRWLLPAIPLAVIMGASAAPGGLVQSVTINPGGNVANLDPQLYVLYSVFFLLYMYTGITWIGARLYRRKATANLKIRLRYIFNALLLAGTLGAFFNLILPLFGNYGWIWVGPLFSIVMVALVFTAIVKHNLFDVRQAVSRTIGYGMLLITMALIYSITIFTVATLFFSTSQTSTIQSGINIVLAVFLAFTYQPLKRFFDRVTNRLFLRESYDLKTTIDQLGDIVVARNTLQSLVRDSYRMLDRTLHPQSMAVIAIDSAGDIIHQKRSEVLDVDWRELSRLLGHRSVTITTNEDIPEKAQSYLRQHHIEAVARLETANQLVGYIILGEKLTGKYNSTDEQLLAVLCDEMAVAFQNALRFEEIEHFNETLQGEVRDATAKLRQTNRKLHELDDAKDDFISMASHQLRTPLTSVKGYLSMVLDGDVGKVTPEQRKVLEEAFNSSQRMVYLISDFLNVSRIQTGKFELERTQSNLAEVLSDEIAQLRIMASSRNLKIDYVQPSHFPIAYIDQDKFRQVMMNFIDNAIYYSNPNTTITISLTKEVDDIVFKVMDQGIGVPPSERHKLFTKFYRASNAKRQRPDGTGIGLFMAQKVIVAHGGSIVFDSKENQGSTFGFRLPLKDNSK